MEQLRIDHNQRQVMRDLDAGWMIQKRAAQIMTRARDRFGKINRFDGLVQRPRFDPHHIEQIGDEAVQPVSLGSGGSELLFLLWRRNLR